MNLVEVRDSWFTQSHCLLLKNDIAVYRILENIIFCNIFCPNILFNKCLISFNSRECLFFWHIVILYSL